ncbi:hypothetical protein PIB30_091278 [Stylosanthes scabra]|uniref:Uncharacterized protein n=1 Tax=Stylosanthes scabra TaxID=79078 RepID=A0ABU6UTY5_9FABA|nr:hypothetical protein [Stylosanthes scabra]
MVAGADRGKNMGVKGAETGHVESAKQVKKREDGAVNGGGGLVGDSGGVKVVECGGYGGRRWCMVRLQRLGVTWWIRWWCDCVGSVVSSDDGGSVMRKGNDGERWLRLSKVVVSEGGGELRWWLKFWLRSAGDSDAEVDGGYGGSRWWLVLEGDGEGGRLMMVRM